MGAQCSECADGGEVICHHQGGRPNLDSSPGADVATLLGEGPLDNDRSEAVGEHRRLVTGLPCSRDAIRAT